MLPGADDNSERRRYRPAVVLERVGERLRRVPALAVDAALAAVVAVANGFAIAAEQEAGSKSPDVLAYLLGVAIAAALLVRRRWLLGIGFRGLEEGESLVSVVGSGTVDDVALLFAVMALAEMLRTRRAWMAEVRGRLRRTEAEREREAERKVEQERLRIAHELHDVLAHTIAVIGVQADVAAEALTDAPSDAEAPLRTIRAKSREALAELRATVGVLREPREEAPRSPVPGLGQLEKLLGNAAGAGVQVE